MPRPSPPKHQQWKKGQSGNPSGRRPDPPELRAIKNLTEEELVEIGSLVVKGNIDDLKRIKDDPNTTVLKAMIAAVAIKTIAKGDGQALEVLLNRLIGKVKDKVEVTSTNQTAITAAVGTFDMEALKAARAKILSDV